MTEEIIVAIISGGISLICSLITLVGVIISNVAAGRKTQARIETAQAVTDTKIDELTRETREHNGFAKRVPVLEEQMKVVNHRLNDFENLINQIIRRNDK